MIKRAASLALVLALAACASGGGGPAGARSGSDGPGFRRTADPGVVVATELAFARMAKDKGQWTAFAEYAAKDAVMFVPEPVKAHEWLKGRANPAASVEWEPYQVWSSCDGSLAVTKGPWKRADGSVGYFTTVWDRQEDGTYKRVLDQGDTLEAPLEEPEMVEAEVADCAALTLPPPMIIGSKGTSLSGVSLDGTLRWMVIVGEDGSRSIYVWHWNGTDWSKTISEQVAAG